MEVLDCKKVSDKIRGKVNENLSNINKVLGIAIISIGDNEVNSVYLRKKRNFFRELGVEFREFILPKNPNLNLVFDIYRTAKQNGPKALSMLEKVKQDEDPIMLLGLFTSQALKDFSTRVQKNPCRMYLLY